LEKQTFYFTCHPVHAQSFLHAHQLELHKNWVFAWHSAP
jgi:hypothetical protein